MTKNMQTSRILAAFHLLSDKDQEDVIRRLGLAEPSRLSDAATLARLDRAFGITDKSKPTVSHEGRRSTFALVTRHG